MRHEWHLTSDNWHVGSTLKPLLISVTLQHHKHKTNNIFCSYRTEFKVPGSWGKEAYHSQQDCLVAFSSTPNTLWKKFLQAKSHTWKDLPLNWYFKKHGTRAVKFSYRLSPPYNQNSLILHLCRRKLRSCSMAEKENIISSTFIYACFLDSHCQLPFSLLLSNFSCLSKSSHL